MAISCNIKRNNGRVVSVKAPNGKPSLLFKSLKSFLGDSNKAADYWLLTYTDLFKKSKGDWTNPKDTSIEVDKNGEPILSEVLSYIGENETGQKLPLQDRLDLYNNLQALGDLDIEDVYDKLNTAFFKEDGNFAPTRKSLKDSGLYNESEIDQIMSDLQIQNSIERLINRLSITRDRNGQIPTTSTVQQNPPETTVDTNDLIGIGKFRVLPYEDTFKEIASKVAGITNRKAFDQAMQDVELPSVVSRYNQNKQFANYIFNKYSDLKAIPVVTDRNGRLGQQIENDTVDILETTLIVDADKEGVRENIDTLMSIEDDVWNDSPAEVGVLLDEIADKLKDSNIDLQNLSNVPLSPNEYRTFLTSLRDFIDKMDNGVLDFQDIQEFALEYDRTFFIERTPEYNYTQNPTNAAIFQLDTRKSEIEVYRDYSMIKVRDNLYRKVQDKPIETLYDELSQLTTQNPQQYNEQLTSDPRQFISDQVQQHLPSTNNDIVEKIEIYKAAFGYTNQNDSSNIVQKIQEMSNFEGNEEYLTTDFISDFQNFILDNNEQEVSNDFFRYFKFEDGVIKLEADPSVIQVLRDLVNQDDSKIFKDLLNYARISRDEGIRQLLPTQDINANENLIESERRYYTSNPQDAPRIDNFAEVGGSIVNKDIVQGNFVQAGNNLYERVATYKGADIYSEVVVNDNKDFLLSPVPPTPPKDLRVFDNLIQPSNTELEIETLYDNKELKEINDKIDSCGS